MIRLTVESHLADYGDIFSRFIKQSLIKIRQRMRRLMSEPKSGRLYRRKRGEGFTRSHRASAIGEPYATDTGRAANSFEVIMLNSLDGAIETNLEYPAILEEKRPTAVVAVEQLIPELENDLAQMLAR